MINIYIYIIFYAGYRKKETFTCDPKTLVSNRLSGLVVECSP